MQTTVLEVQVALENMSPSKPYEEGIHGHVTEALPVRNAPISSLHLEAIRSITVLPKDPTLGQVMQTS